MIAYGVIRERIKILQSRQREIEAEWPAVEHATDEAGQKRQYEVLAAAQVNQGRIFECQLWLEWLERWPHIERADQLPTERNMLRHDAVADKKDERTASREREVVHRINADQLSAALPDLAGK